MPYPLRSDCNGGAGVCDDGMASIGVVCVKSTIAASNLVSWFEVLRQEAEELVDVVVEVVGC